MAGETDRTHAHSKHRARKLAHLDDRSTDKYYKSSQVSGLSVPPRVPQRPQAPPQPRPQTRAPRQPLGPTPTLKRPGAIPSVATSGRANEIVPDVFHLAVVEDLAATIDAVVAKLKGGSESVTVAVADVPGLLPRARALLETKVTREIITEDAARDVRFRKAAVPRAGGAEAAPAQPPPAPRGETVQADKPLTEDEFESLLSGGETETVDVSPVEPTVVDMTETGPKEVDDDNDFLAQVLEPEAPVESKKPGRRSGRGAR